MEGHSAHQRALVDASARFTELLREVPEPERRMRKSQWSPVDAAIHVLQLLRIFLELSHGKGSPYTRHEEFSRISDELIAAEPERDPARLAAALEAATQSWLEAAGGRPATDPFDWHGVVDISYADASGILLGEFLLHGLDIARSARRPWRLSADDARTVMGSILGLLPVAVDQERAAGVRAAYDVRIRGMTPLTFRFDDGVLTIRPTDGPVDCHLAGDPVAVMLVAYGRWSQWQAIGRGRLVAWGRRPDLAFRFTSLLRDP